ncbi:P12 family lipoprotein [Borrelia persica]|uniref:P12 family lipoprotein n=1 Tax=Borrelia persica TaxID=44448 RepID=UPI000463B2F1|nr:P12 family lipoprotein [Borrelia persica]
MKKDIRIVFMFMLLLLLSCDADILNDFIARTKIKPTDKNQNIEDLRYMQTDQEGGVIGLEESEEGVGIKSVEKKLEPQIIQRPVIVPSKPVNEVFEPVSNHLYFSQKAIVVEEKDIIPTTKEEKDAESKIEDVKKALKDTSFSQLFENASKLKSRAEQVRVDLSALIKEVEAKRSLLKSKYDNLERNVRPRRVGTLSQSVKILRELSTQLKVVYDLEDIINRISEGIDGIKSAEFFFKRANDLLSESIIKRLQNKRLIWSRRDRNVVWLSRNAQRDAETSLSNLTYSVMNIGEATGRLNEIKVLIDDAKLQLVKIK